MGLWPNSPPKLGKTKVPSKTGRFSPDTSPSPANMDPIERPAKRRRLVDYAEDDEPADAATPASIALSMTSSTVSQSLIAEGSNVASQTPSDSQGDQQITSRFSSPAPAPAVSRTATPDAPPPSSIASLSNELLLRILAHLPPHAAELVRCARVSRRWQRVAGDSALWRRLYWERFVVAAGAASPWSLLIDADSWHSDHQARRRRAAAAANRSAVSRRPQHQHQHQHHHSKRSANVVDDRIARDATVALLRPSRRWWRGLGWSHGPDDDAGVDWKMQYRLSHNWAAGRCTVGELCLDAGSSAQSEGNAFSKTLEEDRARGKDRHSPGQDASADSKVLARIAAGLAITADSLHGLRAWDVRTRRLLAETSFASSRTVDADEAGEACPRPVCLAIDDGEERDGISKIVGVAVGFADGSWGAWQVDPVKGCATRVYYRRRDSAAVEKTLRPWIAAAYSHPYLLTATSAADDVDGDGIEVELRAFVPATQSADETECEQNSLPHPVLVTSLRSQTSRPPLALSIHRARVERPNRRPSVDPRRVVDVVVSVVYTVLLRDAWCIGVQAMHVSSRGGHGMPGVVVTRLAHTAPVPRSGSAHSRSRREDEDMVTPPGTPPRQAPHRPPTGPSTTAAAVGGPTAIAYAHPFLLATLPDNTLMLHVVRSTASALQILQPYGPSSPAGPGGTSHLPSPPGSPPLQSDTGTAAAGLRLFGHTSGVASADVTRTGRAVSVTRRGGEVRVWELGSAAAVSGSVRWPAGYRHERDHDGHHGHRGHYEHHHHYHDSRSNEPSRRRHTTSRTSCTATVGGKRKWDAFATTLGDGMDSCCGWEPSPTSIEVQAEEEVGEEDAEDAVRDDGPPSWSTKAGPGVGKRRSWVGFDDEMVLVLEEGSSGHESLVVYDFA